MAEEIYLQGKKTEIQWWTMLTERGFVLDAYSGGVKYAVILYQHE